MLFLNLTAFAKIQLIRTLKNDWLKSTKLFNKTQHFSQFS